MSVCGLCFALECRCVGRPPRAIAADAPATADIELAYGLLWRCGCDRRTADAKRRL